MIPITLLISDISVSQQSDEMVTEVEYQFTSTNKIIFIASKKKKSAFMNNSAYILMYHFDDKRYIYFLKS